ncbi:hypothetical protein [Bradyrhizobium sp. CCGUVB23]|uniref:hypothetical protein n=1 Tax=Bradyrhizobium sp. CCGUVB23 TaxID=2949630 RepID=UPI0020B41170|nr:hypothetical protein [Bradyrhizobium sp. CCGUVB23]MCP3460592.1 hypothetical protein [Bradyrhizobium sp. CCGUVB23]
MLIAWRKKGGWRFAYDTAKIETLFIEFPELPIPTADWAELGWTRLGFQTGNLTLYFASIAASGRIEVRWGRDFLTLLLRHRRAEICIDARGKLRGSDAGLILGPLQRLGRIVKHRFELTSGLPYAFSSFVGQPNFIVNAALIAGMFGSDLAIAESQREISMAMATGRLYGPPEERKDANYSSLLGFVAQPVRIDPHTHDAEQSPQINLRDIAETIRRSTSATE